MNKNNFLTEEFLKALPKDIKNKTVVCALSGGIDSIVLTHCFFSIAKQSKIKIVAAHLNHMIRKEAQSESDFVKEFCETIGIQLFLKNVDVIGFAKTNKQTIEQAARNQRYQFLNEVATQTNATYIATGHHAQDQAETILLNLCRGCGLVGVGGIKPKTQNRIRPMLFFEKQQIIDYAKQNKLSFCVDESNSDIKFSRNRIRAMIPQFEKINKNFINNVVRTGSIATKDYELIYEMANCVLEKIKISTQQVDEIAIDIFALKQQNKQLRSHIYFVALQKIGLINDFFSKHVGFIEKLLEKSGKLQLPNNFYVQSNDKILIFGKDKENVSKIIIKEKYCIEIQDFAQTQTPDGIVEIEQIINAKQLSLGESFPSKIELGYDGKLFVRSRKKGDTFLNLGASGKKKLKDFYIDKKIDHTRRNGPLIVNEKDEILCIVGIALSEHGKVDQNKKNIVAINFSS